MSRKHIYCFVVLSICLYQAIACGGCEQLLPGEDNEPPEPAVKATYEPMCKVGKYACTLAEADSQALDTSTLLLNLVAQAHKDGVELETLVADLKTTEGVRWAHLSSGGISFLYEGAIPVSYSTSGRLNQAAPTRLHRRRKRTPKTRTYQQAMEAPKPAVVGGKPEDQSRRTYPKRAIVLSPFQWEFAPDDPGKEVVEMLKNTPDYQHPDARIDYLENENVHIDTFTTLTDYDFIMINTHGGAVAGENGNSLGEFILTAQPGPTRRVSIGDEKWETIKATVATKSLSVVINDLLVCDLDQIKQRFPNQEGISCSVRNEDGRQRGYYTLNNDYFASTYFVTKSKFNPNQLEERIVIINACQSMYDDKRIQNAKDREIVKFRLAKYLTGQKHGVAFGWTQDTRIRDGRVALVRLAEKLLRDGKPTDVAYSELCEEIGNQCIQQDALDAQLIAYQPGRPLYAREPMTILSPSFASVTKNEDAYRLMVIDFNANQATDLLFKFQLDGWQESWFLDPRKVDPINGLQTSMFIDDGQKTTPLQGSFLLSELFTPLNDQQYVSDSPYGASLTKPLEIGKPFSIQLKMKLPASTAKHPAWALSPRIEHTLQNVCNVTVKSPEATGTSFKLATWTNYGDPTQETTADLQADDAEGNRFDAFVTISGGQIKSVDQISYTRGNNTWTWTPDEDTLKTPQVSLITFDTIGQQLAKGKIIAQLIGGQSDPLEVININVDFAAHTIRDDETDATTGICIR